MKNIFILIVLIGFIENVRAQWFPFEEGFESAWTFQIGNETLPDSIVTFRNNVSFNGDRYLDYLSNDTLYTINNINYRGIRGYIINSINVGTGDIHWQHLFYETKIDTQWQMATRPTFKGDRIYVPLIVEIPKPSYASGYSWEEGNVGLLTLDRHTGAVIDKFASDYYTEGNMLLEPPYVWTYYDNRSPDLFYDGENFKYFRFSNEFIWEPGGKGLDLYYYSLLDKEGKRVDTSFTAIQRFSNIRIRQLTYTEDLSITSSNKYEIRDSSINLIGNAFFIDRMNSEMQITDSIDLSDIGVERIDFHGYNEKGDLLISNFDTDFKGMTYYVLDWDKNIKLETRLDSVSSKATACYYDDNRIATFLLNSQGDRKKGSILITNEEGEFEEKIKLYTKEQDQTIWDFQIYATPDGGILINFESSNIDLGPGLGWSRSNYWMKFSKDQLDGITSTVDISDQDQGLYPNPATRYLQIESIENVKSISIHDMTGQLIKSVRLSDQIDISDLPSGTYVLRKEYEMGALSTKFVKL